MCDDLAATMAELAAKGIEVRGGPDDEGWGMTTTLVLPGRAGDDAVRAPPRHGDLSRADVS